MKTGTSLSGLLTCLSIIVLFLATAAMIILSIIFTSIVSNGGAVNDGEHNPSDHMDWWKYTLVYQVYPRSFQDSNGDGIGDLNGIRRRVPYLSSLGIKAIWLSPVYQSPMADFGYDVSNFTNIAPVFGTLDDFKELSDEVHKHGMYLIMDFVPNHSSDQHPWFQKSILKEKPYDEYYIWRDQPNNWVSVFGNSTWEYVPSREQYYMHEFLVEQPDLNYRSAALRQEMLNVLKFWVDHGVDGFRIDAVIYLIEDDQFRNEPRSDLDVPPNNHDYLLHNYTQDLPETYEVIGDFAKLLSEYGQSHNKHIFTCTEGSTTINNIMKYYQHGIDFPFNFNLVKWDSYTNASQLRSYIRSWMDNMPAGAWPNWVMGDHDTSRIATRLGGRQYIDVANMLLLLLPGTPTYYYGDEIGMVDANISYADTVDPSGCRWGPTGYMNFSRDPERTPMQWDSSQNAGFSTGKTWLPMADNYETYNVEKELKDPNSHLSIFKSLMQLRQEPVFRLAANLRLIDVGDENVFVFARESDQARYIIILNIGTDGKVSNITNVLGPDTGRVVTRSQNGALGLNYQKKFKEPFILANAEGYVIKTI